MFFRLFFKGIAVGLANMVPGISGGTVLLVLGIYGETMEALSRWRLPFLIPLLLGVGFSILSAAKGIIFLFQHYPTYLLAFLFGLILASVYEVGKTVKHFSHSYTLLALLLGGLLAFSFSQNPGGVPAAEIAGGLFWGGFFGVTAMLLPGISGSTILIIMGQYENILQALVSLRVIPLLIFCSGAFAGLLLFPKAVGYLLRVYPNMMRAFLTGLVAGSLRTVYPQHWGWGEILLTFAGIILVLLLGKQNSSGRGV